MPSVPAGTSRGAAWRSARRPARLLAVIAASFAAVTCDLVTAPGEGGPGISVNYVGATTLIVGTRIPIRVAVIDDASGLPIENLRYTVRTDDPAVVAANGSGDSLIVQGRGRTEVRFTLIGSTFGANPPQGSVEVHAIADSAALDRTSLTFQTLNDTTTLAVTVLDALTDAIDVPAADREWTSSSPAVATVAATGKVTAIANGTAQISVRIKSDTTTEAVATATVTVRQLVTGYLFSPPFVVLRSIGDVATIQTTPEDSGGSAVGGITLPTKTLTVLIPGPVSLVDSTVTAVANGSTQIEVRATNAAGQTIRDTVNVQVAQLAERVTITPGGPVTIDAVGADTSLIALPQDLRNIDVRGRSVTWNATAAGRITVSANANQAQVRAVAVGTDSVYAQMDGKRAGVAITVTNPPRSVRLSLDTLPFVTVGDTASLIPDVRNRVGGLLPAEPVTFRSVDATIADVNTAGRVTARAVGITQVIATVAGGFADTALVTIVNRPATIDIVPATIALASVLDTQTVQAVVLNNRGDTVGQTFGVAWSSEDSTVVAVSGSGRLTARRAGSAKIYATNQFTARGDSVLVVVTNAPEFISLNRVRDTLPAPTLTLAYTPTVRNARGDVILNPSVQWRSSVPAVASVDPQGVATAIATGQTTVIAEVGSGAGLRSASAILAVVNEARSITLSPSRKLITSITDTTSFTADIRNAVNASVSGLQPRWRSLDTTIATVDSITGLVTGVRVGSATIQARVPGTSLTPADATVEVQNAPDFIDIAATARTLRSVTDADTPVVTLRNALGATLPRTAAEWRSDDATIATVTSNGIIAAVARGVTTVRARNAINLQRQDSIAVTVTDGPDSIDVRPNAVALPSVQRTFQFSATAFNRRRAVITGQTVAWSSCDGNVVTMSTTGLATATGVGTTCIFGTARFGADSVRDTSTVSVSNLANTVELNPSALSLSNVGATGQLVATARNELGTVITGATVTWLSSSPAVASVSGTGLVTALSVGTSTISATVDGITDQAIVTVTNPPTTLAITSGNRTLASVGDTAFPAVTFQNAGNPTLPRDAALWTSSDPNVATVSSTGVVTATGAGVATITATSPADAALTSSITVTVTNAPSSVTLNTTSNTLTALGRTLQYVATVRNARNGVIASPSLSWSSNNGTVASVNSATGLATANAAGGPVTITATASSTVGPLVTAAANASLTVTSFAVSLTATPDTAVRILNLGGTTPVAAVARNDLGGLLPDTAIRWQSLDPARATVSAFGANATVTGTASAANVGIARIVASVGRSATPGDSLRDTVFVNVANAPQTINIVAAAGVTLASVNDTVIPAATIQNLAGTTLSRRDVQWETSAPNVASVTDTGVVVALAAGATRITARSPFDPSRFDTVTVTVTNAPVSVVLNATTVSLTALLRTFAFSAVVRNARTEPIAGASVTWSSNNAFTTVNSTSGLATAAAVGGSTITATVVGAPGVTAGATVTVTNNPATITLAPSSITLTSVGAAQSLTPAVLNDLGNAITGQSVSFASAATGVATVAPASGTSTTVSGAGVGTTTITATAGGATASISVVVRNDVATVDLTPNLPTQLTVNILGTTTPTTMTFLNGLGSGTGLTATDVDWISRNASVASVNGSGTITGAGAGTTFIVAQSRTNPSGRDSVRVVVSAPAASIGLDRAGPDSLTAIGRSQQYAATVRDASGNILTGQTITWSSTNAAQVAINPTGAGTSPTTTATAQAVTGGTRVTITASVTSTLGTFNATVLVGAGNDPASIVVAPTSVSLTDTTATQLLRATVRNNLGDSIVGASATWTVSSSSPAGVVTAGSPGPTSTVTAARVGTAAITVSPTGFPGVTASVPVTVTNAPSAINITTASPGTLTSLNDSLLLATTISNAGNPTMRRGAANWSSSNAGVAVVDTGVVIAVGVGTAKIRAESPLNPGVFDTITVTVSNVASSVAIQDTVVDGGGGFVDTLYAAGQQVAYTAVVRNARGAVISGAPLTWGTTSSSVTTVSSSGVVTAGTTSGTSSIAATSGAVTSASVQVTVVTDPTLWVVNKDSSNAQQHGTRRRPYHRIQDAVSAATPGDTVFVMKTLTPYAESLATAASILLQGDSAAAGAGCTSGGPCTTPTALPTIAHQFGSAGIRLAAGTTLRLRHLALTHSVDGPAVEASGAALIAENFYVNPAGGSAQGRGIRITSAPDSSRIVRSRIRSVRGYGVRLENAVNSRVDSSFVDGVAAVSTIADSAAIHFVGGSNNRVRLDTVSGTGTTDGIRFSNTTADTVAASRITGVRHGIHGDGARFLTTGLLLSGGTTGFFITGGDTVVSTGDSIATMTRSCIVMAGSSDVVTLTTARLGNCATGSADTAAVTVDGSGAHFSSTNGRYSNMDRRIVRFATGRALKLNGDTAVGTGSSGALMADSAVISVAASDTAEVINSVVTDNGRRIGLNLTAAARLRVESNRLARNKIGVRVGSTPGTNTMQSNDVYDHDSTAVLGAVNLPSSTALLNNWWGDGRGPRRFALGAVAIDSQAVGDSVTRATGSFASGDYTGTVQTTPNFAGTTATAIRYVRGDAQARVGNGDLLKRLTVRVVDALGRPVSGVAVGFKADSGSVAADDMDSVTVGNQDTLTVTTNASGLAEVRYTLGGSNGKRRVKVTAAALPSTINFRVEQQP